MILAILFYVIAYVIDLFSALTLREFKPKIFAAVEANSHFVRIVDKFGIVKGILYYTAAYTLQMVIIFFLAVMITYRIVFGAFAWAPIFEFAFIFMGCMHCLGLATNLFTLAFKKEPVEAGPEIKISEPTTGEGEKK